MAKNLKDMTVKQRQKIEREIGAAIVKGMLAAGFEVAIDNGGDEDEYRGKDAKAALKAMFATDSEVIYAMKEDSTTHHGKVYMVYGEYGFDVMCDYSVSLEENGILKEALEIADKYDKMWTGA